MKTPDQIIARIHEVRAGDDAMFGWQTDILIRALTFEQAKPFLIADATSDAWPDPQIEDAVRQDAIDYLDFAFGKASDHRGISASRSVDKMGAYLWMLDLDYDRFVNAGYAQYGVPQLFIAAEELGVTPPSDDEGLQRMAKGRPCEPDCTMGCSQ